MPARTCTSSCGSCARRSSPTRATRATSSPGPASATASPTAPSSLVNGTAQLTTQCYYCVVIPPLDDRSGNLPPGVHDAAWSELVARFGSTPHRLMLLAGLKAALDELRTAGCPRAYIDGSFVTA